MNLFGNDLMVIAEIGVNHEGDLNKAKKILEMAAGAGANCVKFQSYTPSRYIAADDCNRFKRISNFFLSVENFIELSKHAQEFGLTFLSTPLTEDWVDMLNPLCPSFKIASGDITFKPVIEKAAKTGKPIIMSTGAATINEIDQAIEWVREVVGDTKLKERLVLMHCISAYPAPIAQANILSIPFLKERYGLHVGYSNHVMGMNACITAVALGANLIEVHFTDCKEGRDFRDHSLSFDESDLRAFVQIAHDIRKSLGTYGKEPQKCELATIPTMRKGVVAARDLRKGQILTQEDLMFARPATEFSANEINQLVGKKINQGVPHGHLVMRDAI